MMQAFKRFRCIYRVLLYSCLLLIARPLSSIMAQDQVIVYNTTSIAKQDSLIPSALLGVRYEITALPPINPNQIGKAQTLMPVNVCANLLNEYDCSRTQEEYLFNYPGTGLLRQGRQLTIPIRPPFALILTDQQGKGGGGWASYTYLGYIPEIQYHYVYVGYYEGGSDLLIQAQTGEITVLPYPPVFSPDYQRFAIVGSYWGNPIMLQVWQVSSTHLNLEVDLTLAHPSIMQIKQQQWVESTKLQLDLFSQLEQAQHTFILAKSGDYWQGYQDDVQIKSLPLYPLTILQENPRTVFDVDTLAVGKRVYQDRDYTFKQVPDYLVDAQYLRLGNNALRNTSADYLHFSLAQPAIVYVAIDDQALHLPDWMAGWQPTPDFLLTDDTVNLRLYKKEVPAGIVTLGGNWATGAAGIRSQYIVIVTNKE